MKNLFNRILIVCAALIELLRQVPAHWNSLHSACEMSIANIFPFGQLCDYLTASPNWITLVFKLIFGIFQMVYERRVGPLPWWYGLLKWLILVGLSLWMGLPIWGLLMSLPFILSSSWKTFQKSRSGSNSQ